MVGIHAWKELASLCLFFVGLILVIKFLIRSYVCDVLEVGLRLEMDENIGIVTRFEIKEKLVLNVGINENALKLKEMAEKSVSEGGSSLKNLKSFVEEELA